MSTSHPPKRNKNRAAKGPQSSRRSLDFDTATALEDLCIGLAEVDALAHATAAAALELACQDENLKRELVRVQSLAAVTAERAEQFRDDAL